MPACPNCGTENPPEARFCMSCASPLEAAQAPREVRKTVTVVFADVVGSTPLGERLDPEALRRVMGRYFDRMRAVVERHGGSVEKFIGDAVMAVFGIPVLHEDDALRAVRAAAEMREALEELNSELERDHGVAIQARMGVNTGEVVAGTSGETLATGDTINTAARLQQAAGSREILLGESTRRLVRDAVRVRELDPLALKGKDASVVAFLLLEALPGVEPIPRRLDSPLVGRAREWQLLRLAYERAVEEGTCHLVTVLGAAGVGKSRLVEEFLRSLSDDVTVLRGRCLSYGDGITFWPVIETVRQSAGIGEEDDPDQALAKLREAAGQEDGDLIADRVAQVIGLVADSAVPEETFWALRRLLEIVASRRPLVVVFDDIHWAEPTFLDFVEHLTDWSREAPILVLCMSRPELLDDRPNWGGGKMNATVALLEPLGEPECQQLIANLLGQAKLSDEVESRIIQAAEGNPLFVEEMLSMLIDDGRLRRDDGHWVAAGDLSSVRVPPSIQALIAARLDRLADEERAVMERASVVGRVFYRGAVSELSPEPLRPAVPGHLMTLVRRELIRPHRSEFGQETFRFRHLLIRDQAYEAMPKEVRAELHERFAEWLRAAVGDRLREYEEILGYHLEQAHRYRAELGPLDEAGERLARQAGELLGRAGLRAHRRGDARGAVNLLNRTVTLLDRDDPARLRLLPELAESLQDSAELDRAGEVAREAIARSGQVDAAVEVRARVAWIFLRLATDPAFSFATGLGEAEELLRRAEHVGDDETLVRAQEAAGALLFWVGRSADAVALLDRAIEQARVRGASPGEMTRLYSGLSGPTIWGVVSTDEGIPRWESIAETTSGLAEATARDVLAALRAMRGELEEARRQSARADALHRELGARLQLATAQVPAMVELLGGDAEAAEARLRSGIETLQEIGETGFLSTSAAILGEALVAQGRYEEAESFTRLSERSAAADDIASQIQWRTARSAALAGRGQYDEAEALARAVVEQAERMDYLTVRGDALLVLAQVLAATGRRAEAAHAAEKAIGFYERKGNRVSAERARRLMSELGE